MAPRAKYNWTEITSQFMASDLEDFGAFLRAHGYPSSIGKLPEARGIGEKKRGVIKRIENRVQDAMLSDPVREREAKRKQVLAQLETMGNRLRTSVMVRLDADSVMTRFVPGETPEQWGARITSLQITEQVLSPSDLMGLAGAARVADDILRKATGLEDYDWEADERNAKLAQKGRKAMEIEIVKTSNARALDNLPVAEEGKKKA